MKILAIAACCLVMTGLAVGLCVTVEPNDKPSSQNVQVTTVRNGKPLKNVKLEVLALGAQKGFLLSTNDDGVAMLPALHPGKQCIAATTPDSVTRGLCLDVSLDAKGKTSSFAIDLPPTQTQQELAKAETMPVHDRVQEFRGNVQDPSGAVVPHTKIEVWRKGSQDKTYVIQVEAEANGHFSAHLADGVYMAFFRASGFRTNIALLEVGEKQAPKDLQIVLVVGPGCT